MSQTPGQMLDAILKPHWDARTQIADEITSIEQQIASLKGEHEAASKRLTDADAALATQVREAISSQPMLARVLGISSDQSIVSANAATKPVPASAPKPEPVVKNAADLNATSKAVDDLVEGETTAPPPKTPPAAPETSADSSTPAQPPAEQPKPTPKAEPKAEPGSEAAQSDAPKPAPMKTAAPAAAAPAAAASQPSAPAKKEAA